MASILKAVCVFLFAALVIAPPAAVTAIQCGDVITKLAPCLNFVMAGGPITPQCCAGVNGLNRAAGTTPDRRIVCGCLKTLAGRYNDAAIGNAARLPGSCGVRLPYPIRRDVDCGKV
ncbi:non-specific lipid-transfer protein, partial [Genlisea aurea]